MTKNLTDGPPGKLILMFTLPLIAGNVFMQLYSFVDTLLVGRFLGVHALAAVGCTGSLMFLMLGFVIGSTSGFSIYTGQRFGARDEDGVKQSAAACVFLSFVLSVVTTIIGLLAARPLLELIETPAEIIDDAYSFISIVYGGVALFIFLQMQMNIIRALGDSTMPTVISAFGLTMNIIFEPIALLILDGGIPGAAYATLLSQVCGNIFAFVYIKRKIPILHPRKEHWKFTLKILWAHIKIGLPMGFQMSIIAIGAVTLQFALNNFGATVVASYAAAQKVDAIASMPMMSFGVAMAAYTAQNYGARKFGRIIEGLKKCTMMSVGFSLVAGAFQIFFGSELIALFVGADQTEVIEYGKIYLLINGASYWILALLFITRNMLQGLGSSSIPTAAGIMELTMRVVAAIVVADIFGYVGACTASPLAWIGAMIPLAISTTLTMRRLKKAYKRELEIEQKYSSTT